MTVYEKKTLSLLPFQYKKMDDSGVLLVNLCGEFRILTADEFSKLINAKYPEELGELYYPLKGMHIVADGDVDLAVELLSVKLRSKKAYLKSFTSLHMVVATARCNCICDYCQASSSDTTAHGMDMTPEIAEKTVDIIMQSPSPGIKIEFQGGEPTLNWPIIELIVKRAEEINKTLGKDLSFVICSNLMHAEEKWAYFCKEHKISFSTSLDGPKDCHDLHRISRDGKSSYDRFIKNLEFYRSILGPGACCALLTITKDNLNRLPEVIDHYREHGFRKIFLRSLSPYGFAVKNNDAIGYDVGDFIKAYREALDYIISLNLKGIYFAELYTELLLMRILTPFSTGFVDLQSPSGAGISGAVYDFNGEVYPADEGRMLARMGNKRFLMGNVLQDSYDKIFNGEVIRELVRNSCVENLSLCAHCAYQAYCGADPVRYYAESGDIRGRRPASEFCRKNMGVMDYIFEKLLENNEEVIKVFWSWIHQEDIRCDNCESN
ncbi:MAG: His-Xaa-Ser system radical SAM maturase HxsB [Firmicutes bacterium]|nr:His-Xaa-Ser system radical SAM maturase HxsB [Bacillota bacterium]